ncbi:MAG TPA: ATP-binding protein, partial [bacterium]|nr:ATP-binding protein [bacterium]
DEWEFLVPYESHLATALQWAERNAITGYGPPVWRSGLVIEEGEPESWATAEVYAFLQLYVSYLTWRIETVVLKEFRSQGGQPPDPQAFDGLYQPEVYLPDEEPVLLTDLLRERLLDGLRAPGHRPVYSLVHHPDRRRQPRSGILFGPPGTGKTTYVKKVAAYLGWPLVILDPSDFASEGLPLIATVAGEVFAKLLELEDAVIFFDEMESLMQRRDGNGANGGSSFEQQFLTTTFIPKLQELADRSACLFFVATNHYESIDPAARRPGRFDFRLQVLPPAYEEKLRMARKALGDDYPRVETELTRQSNRRNIALATRSEMMRLVQDLQRAPERVEELLNSFRAELGDDERVDHEARYNSFEHRS